MGLTMRACPSCGSHDRAGEGRVSSSPAAESMEALALHDQWAGFFQDQHVFFTYERCAGCGLRYCPSYLGGDALAELYASMGDNTAGVPPRLLQRTQDRYFRCLARYSPLQGVYLEFGPDVGMFTARAAADGRFDSLLLCEPNIEVHADLRSIIGDRGRIASELSDPSFLADGEKVDVVVLVHVLDHLVDPLGLLRRLRAHCHPSSTLFLVTHDESSVLARLLGPRWPAFCLQHPLLFRRRTLGHMLGRAGFEVVHSAKSVNHFPLGYMARHLLFALGAPDLHLPAGGPGIALRLGNLATVARPAIGVR